MFENLSNREKKLLLGVGALVPIAIVFVGIFQLISMFEVNNSMLTSLDTQIAEPGSLQVKDQNFVRETKRLVKVRYSRCLPAARFLSSMIF